MAAKNASKKKKGGNKEKRRAFFLRAEQPLSKRIVLSAEQNRRTLNAECLRLIELGLEVEENRSGVQGGVQHIGSLRPEPPKTIVKGSPSSDRTPATEDSIVPIDVSSNGNGSDPDAEEVDPFD